MFRPCISATQVASLIGRNPYQTASQTMYDVFKKDKALVQVIERIEHTHNRKSVSRFKNSFLRDRGIQDSVAAALDKCKVADVAAANEVDAIQALLSAEARSHELDMKVAAGIEVPQTEKDNAAAAVAVALAKKTVAEAAVALAPTVKDTLESVEAACQKVIDRTPNLPKAMAAQLLSDARGRVSTQRGLTNETAILDDYAAKRNVVVTERNSRMLRMDKGAFVLVGRTDGYVEAQKRVVDSKNRTRYFQSPPGYDEIQMRVYMHLLDAKDAELIEKFPNGTTRTTIFVNDPDVWSEIEGALDGVVQIMVETAANPSSLEAIVLANTVENGD